MEKKYELTDETIEYEGRTLHRIRALKDFGMVEKGEMGGYVEGEYNLSHNGESWIFGNAKVCGDARIHNNAIVCGKARIEKKCHIITIENIGSRNGTTTFYRNKNNGISVDCGCFGGTIEEFGKAVRETHEYTKHFDTYTIAIELAKLQIELD